MLTRRNLLVAGVQVSAACLAGPSLGARSVSVAARGQDERVLVVLQLTGGNDGLNTVVPFGQDQYYRLRPNLGLAKGALHRLDDMHGLHPAMGGMAELFGEAKVAVIQGVANPSPNRSHFRSMEVWHTAEPNKPVGDIGWLGRLSDQIAREDQGSMPALAIGASNLPLSMRAERSLAPTVQSAAGFEMDPRSEELAAWRNRLIEGDTKGDLGYLRIAARSTYDAVRRMEAIAAKGTSVEYPETELARQFELVAGLITGGFGTRVFTLEVTGFDTHARQTAVHAELLGRVSDAIAAFQKDLTVRGVADNVLTFAFSEFGRRAAENGSKGTDHGRGAPVFLVGNGVRPGIHGSAPDLEDLVEGDIPGTTDFRALYSAMERDWMGLVPSSRIKPAPVLTD
ncbi:MAG: hypothetical protein ACI8PQ_002708 [Planctomycetota bacterium]|jgi:uncharacterized protein (DUF1501 family)